MWIINWWYCSLNALLRLLSIFLHFLFLPFFPSSSTINCSSSFPFLNLDQSRSARIVTLRWCLIDFYASLFICISLLESNCSLIGLAHDACVIFNDVKVTREASSLGVTLLIGDRITTGWSLITVGSLRLVCFEATFDLSVPFSLSFSLFPFTSTIVFFRLFPFFPSLSILSFLRHRESLRRTIIKIDALSPSLF